MRSEPTRRDEMQQETGRASQTRSRQRHWKRCCHRISSLMCSWTEQGSPRLILWPTRAPWVIRRSCLGGYKHQVHEGRYYLQERPRGMKSWEHAQYQSLSEESYTVEGPMCVCVDHLHRCKTSLFGWRLFFVFYLFCIIIAGGHRRPIELCPTKLSMVSLGYPGWSPGRTCTRFETFDCHGTWLTQEPPRRFSVASGPSSELQCQQVSIHCTVFAIWIIADFVRWNSCFLQGQRKNSSLWVFPCHVLQLLPVRL